MIDIPFMKILVLCFKFIRISILLRKQGPDLQLMGNLRILQKITKHWVWIFWIWSWTGSHISWLPRNVAGVRIVWTIDVLAALLLTYVGHHLSVCSIITRLGFKENLENVNNMNSAGADGGPRSWVWARLTLRTAPHWHQQKFVAHMFGRGGKQNFRRFWANFLFSKKN